MSKAIKSSIYSIITSVCVYMAVKYKSPMWAASAVPWFGSFVSSMVLDE